MLSAKAVSNALATLGALCLAPPAFAADTWLEGGVDLAEVRIGKGGEVFVWESAASWGDDRDRAVLEFEGNGEIGQRMDEIEASLLYERALGGSATLIAGVRQDMRPAPYRTFAVLGAEAEPWPGGALESLMFLSDAGKLTGEVELVSEHPLAPRLSAQGRATLGWAAQALPGEDVASGLTDLELALRLRYRATPAISPYLGVVHGRLLGRTDRLARIAGAERRSTHFAVGLSLVLGGEPD